MTDRRRGGRLLTCLATIAGATCLCKEGSSAEEKNVKQEDILFEDDFSKGLENWVHEGPPKRVVEVRDGALYIDPRDWGHAGVRGANVWCRRPIDGDWVMEFDLEPMAPKPEEGKKANLLFAFCAGYKDPEPDFIEFSEERTGHYFWITCEPNMRKWRSRFLKNRRIPPMENYTITYYRLGSKPYKMVARKNPGFHLMGEVGQGAEDHWAFRHRVRIQRRGEAFAFYRRGKKLFAFADDGRSGPAYKGGYFCIRTWRAAVKVYSVKVWRPKP